jgi:uncharacterized membrane protein
MAPLRITGIVSCGLIIISLFLNWAWYPDIQKYFTAFFTEGNHYGKPGKFLLFFAVSGLVFYWLNKAWTQRLNLIFSALCIAFAIRTYLLFTSSYDGYVPEAKTGLYLMLLGCIGHLVASMGGLAVVKKQVDEKADLAVSDQA